MIHLSFRMCWRSRHLFSRCMIDDPWNQNIKNDWIAIFTLPWLLYSIFASLFTLFIASDYGDCLIFIRQIVAEQEIKNLCVTLERENGEKKCSSNLFSFLFLCFFSSFLRLLEFECLKWTWISKIATMFNELTRKTNRFIKKMVVSVGLTLYFCGCVKYPVCDHRKFKNGWWRDLSSPENHNNNNVNMPWIHCFHHCLKTSMHTLTLSCGWHGMQFKEKRGKIMIKWNEQELTMKKNNNKCIRVRVYVIFFVHVFKTFF